ncbi:MAG: HEAT repeat protein [Candidatus Paceibacteria bacterium]|jgi:HEAT repeat protein
MNKTMNKTMNRTLSLLLICLLSAIAAISSAQDELGALKIAALEALITAPPSRALPIVQRVLKSDDREDIKARALFVLSQIDLPEAHATLVAMAQDSTGALQFEAIRMIGVSGAPEAMASLAEIYAAGSEDVRGSVLKAYLIADDSQAVYRIAAAATDPQELERALHMLGAMGAVDEVRALGARVEMYETLAQAYAMTGDIESLRKMAFNDAKPEAQVFAIRSLGLTSAPAANAALLNIYREQQSQAVRHAALEGLMISGYDQGVLALYRETQDIAEKRELLRFLVMMGSDAVWDEIDQALDERP